MFIPDFVKELNTFEKQALSGFSYGAHLIYTNNDNSTKEYVRSYALGSHVIIRQKNHLDLKDAVLAKKYKVPRDIRDDFLI